MAERRFITDLKKEIDSLRHIKMDEYLQKVSEEYVQIGDCEHYGFKLSGSDAEQEGAEYIKTQLEMIGIDKVEKVPFKTIRYQFNDADLVFQDAEGQQYHYKPGPYASPATPEEGITAELIDIGNPDQTTFESVDMNGKIVMIEAVQGVAGMEHSFAIRGAERNGAVAVIVFHNDNLFDEDTLRTQICYEVPGIPVIGINLKQAKEIKEALKKGSINAQLKLDIELDKENGISTAVVGEIIGKNPNERVVYSGHIDHYFKCMQDNISSVAAMLGVAKAMKESGYQPERTISFLFNASHEVGTFKSLSPYIFGSFKVLDGAKKDWVNTIVAEINFEYVALYLKELRITGSYELVDAYLNHVKYQPKEVEGFGKVAKDVRVDDYYFAAWADSISFISKGAPIIAPDVITDQMTTGDSPYTGRDHSTSDNWDTYRIDTLAETVRWYGGLGVYFSEMPLPEYNFATRAASLKLSDDEKNILDEFAIGYDEYNKIIEAIGENGNKLFDAVAIYNDNNYGNESVDRAISKKILEVQSLYSAATDFFDASNMLMIEHKKYINSITLLQQGKCLLDEGNGQKAVDEVLRFIDYLNVPYTYGSVDAEFIQELYDMNDEKLWNRDKCSKILILPELMLSLRNKIEQGINDYNEEIKMIDEAVSAEAKHLKMSLEREARSLVAVNEQIVSCLKMMQ